MTLVAHLPERALVGAVVVDPSGEWLESWALRVMAMGATHVRSALSMTPFPDADGLRAFCEKRGNRKEDVLAGTDDRPPVPSCRAYAEYCGSRVRRTQVPPRASHRRPRREAGPGRPARGRRRAPVAAAQAAPAPAARPVVPSWSEGDAGEGESGDAKGASKDATLAVADVDLEACDLEAATWSPPERLDRVHAAAAASRRGAGLVVSAARSR